MVKKINLTITQLIASDLFLGYYVTNWNPRTNFFLLGSYRRSNIFNVNYTYSFTKKFVNFVSDLIGKKCQIWLVNENFTSFDRSKEFSRLALTFKELSFINSKWYKGTLSNFKYVEIVKPSKFPHAIFVPNMSNNHFIINESFLINIPSWALCDTLDNPSNVFFPIPSNSKSIKSALFFYLLSAKAVLYSRHRDTSSFLFIAFKKSKRFLSSTSLPYFLERWDFLDRYFLLFKKPSLTQKITFVLHAKHILKHQFSFVLHRKLKKYKKLYLIRWKLPLILLTVLFSNVLTLVLNNKIRKKINFSNLSYGFFKHLAKLFI